MAPKKERYSAVTKLHMRAIIENMDTKVVTTKARGGALGAP